MHPVFDISELNRRVANLILAAKVVEVDYRRARVKAQSGELVSGWLPWLTQRAGLDRSWWAPSVGEQVLVLSPSGDPAQGMVLPGLYQDAHDAPSSNPDDNRVVYRDGAVFSYDRARHHWDIRLPAGATVALIASGGVSIEGDVTVTGDIKATGDIEDQTRSMRADRDIYNRHTHRGDSGGTTGNPGASQ